jgi:hypothetical protein
VYCTTDAALASGSPYGIKDVVTDDTGRVCLWLPATDLDDGSVGLKTEEKGYEKQYVRPASSSSETLNGVSVTSVTPSGIDVSIAGNLEIGFNLPMNTASPGAVRLVPSSGPIVVVDTSQGSWSEDKLTFSVSYGGLAYGMNHKVEIEDFKTGLCNFPLDLDDTHSFKTIDSYELAVNPGTWNFGIKAESYASSPEAKTFTIINTGTASLTGVMAEITGTASDEFSPDAFVTTSALSSSTIAYGTSNASIRIQPVTGLPARHAPYKAKLYISWNDGKGGRDSTEAAISFTVASYGAVMNPTEHDFGVRVEGYESSTLPEIETFTLGNTGTTTLTGVTAVITGEALGLSPSAFTVVGGSIGSKPSAVAYASSGRVGVQPVVGLPARSEPYKAILYLSWDDGKGGRDSTEAAISFTVSDHKPIYNISIDATSWNFGEENEGYSEAPRHRFKVTNVGNVTLTGIQPTFEGSDVKSFEVDAFEVVQQAASVSPSKGAKKDLALYKLAPGQYTIVEASPKLGLSARKTPYRTDLIVSSSEGASASSSAQFKVDATSSGGKDGGKGGEKGGDRPDTGNLPDTGDIHLEALFAALILSGLLALILALLLMKGRASSLCETWKLKK